MCRKITILGFVFISAGGLANATEPPSVTHALAKALGVNARQQKFLKLVPAGKEIQLLFDRDAFSAQTGIDFLSLYLPRQIKFDLKYQNGFYMLSALGLDRYSARTSP